MAIISTALVLAAGPVRAASTDIVPRASTLTDDLSCLASAGLVTGSSGLTLSPADFQTGALWTRGQMAEKVADILDNSELANRAEGNPRTALALRDAADQLRAEMLADNLSTDKLPGGKASSAALLSAMGGVESRNDRSSDTPKIGGTVFLYRAAAAAQLGRDARVVVGGSNWWRDERRVFANDIGPRHFSGLSAAYLNLNGAHGLTAQIGRLTDRWGPGAHGATLLSDNSPPFDQLRVDFPFSLGPRLGREYHFTQMVTGFKENGQTKIFEARRIAYTFSPKWSADFEEAFKSSQTRSLIGTLLPFNFQASSVLQKLTPGAVSDLDTHFNYNVNLGASYKWGADSRLYGQFFIDDMKSPFADRHKVVPRKVAYLAGYAGGAPDGLNYAIEYSQADPTTYTYQNNDATWQHGNFDWIGLPEGPNNRTLYGRLGVRLAPKLTLDIEGRDRRRYDDSYPAATSRYFGGTAGYRFNRRAPREKGPSQG